jgi:hypothetical protein
MAKCKICGKEFTPRNIKQLFCSNQKDGKDNCHYKNKLKVERSRFKKKAIFEPKVDELSLLSSKLFRGGL